MNDPNKMDAYVDIDGVLFSYPTTKQHASDFEGEKDRLNLRPRATSFLYWMDANFNCFWLTKWRQEAIQLAKCIYAKPAMLWPVCDFQSHKTESIDFTRDFVWIDDDPSDEDYEALKRYKKEGVFSQLVLADPCSHFELETIRTTLIGALAAYNSRKQQ